MGNGNEACVRVKDYHVGSTTADYCQTHGVWWGSHSTETQCEHVSPLMDAYLREKERGERDANARAWARSETPRPRRPRNYTRDPDDDDDDEVSGDPPNEI